MWETRVEYDIAESGIFPMTTREVIELLPEGERAAALGKLLDTRLIYTEARGTEELRKTIAATYDGVTPDDILVTTGAIEANYLLFNSLLDRGDHVVAMYPAYQQLYSVIQAIGCNVALWGVRQDGGFHFDLADLEQLLTPATKMIVINTPHNPTGAVLSSEDMACIYGLAEAYGAVVLCDEAYRWLELPGGERLPPPMRNLGTRAISVGTLSKPFGLPGLRIGWIAATQDIISRCWDQRDYISLAPGRLNDALAVIALQNRDQIISRNNRILAVNLAAADAWFAANSDIVSWNRPKAGLLALMKYESDIPSLEVANWLADEFSVMLAPGSAFGFEGHLRIGVGQKPEIFAEGLMRAGVSLRAMVRSGMTSGAPV